LLLALSTSRVPRDDAPVPLVNDADLTKLHPAKAPLLKKLAKPLLQGLLGAKEEKMPGGTMKYDGDLDGTSVRRCASITPRAMCR
jgi:hypothetical protein